MKPKLQIPVFILELCVRLGRSAYEMGTVVGATGTVRERKGSFVITHSYLQSLSQLVASTLSTADYVNNSTLKLRKTVGRDFLLCFRH